MLHMVNKYYGIQIGIFSKIDAAAAFSIEVPFS